MKFKLPSMSYHVASSSHPADSAESVVLLHGFTGCSANWASHVPAIEANGFHVTAVDLPGHGRTDSPTDPDLYRMSAVAADLAIIFEKLSLQQMHLLGYSMGGRLALYFALHHPELVRSLTLESASPGLQSSKDRRQRKDSDDALAAWIEEHGIEPFVDRWEQIPLFRSQRKLPQAERLNLRSQRLQNQAVGLAHSLRGMGTGVQPSLWPELGGLRSPIHIMVGGLDEKFCTISEQMTQLMPRAHVTTIPDAGHAIHLEQAGLFQEAVIDWWRNPIYVQKHQNTL